MTHISEGAWAIAPATELDFWGKVPDVGLFFASFFKCDIMHLPCLTI